MEFDVHDVQHGVHEERVERPHDCRSHDNQDIWEESCIRGIGEMVAGGNLDIAGTGDDYGVAGASMDCHGDMIREGGVA